MLCLMVRHTRQPFWLLVRVSQASSSFGTALPWAQHQLNPSLKLYLLFLVTEPAPQKGLFGVS